MNMLTGAAGVVLIVGVGPACAAVMSNFGVVNSSLSPSTNIIDWQGFGQEVDETASGATAQTTLEARTDILVLNDLRQTGNADNSFGGSGGSQVPSGASNIWYWTNAALQRPAIRLTGDSNARSNFGAASSGGSSTGRYEGVNIVNNSTGNVVFTIDFGAYDAGTSTFNGATNHVKAAGFTMSSLSLGMTVEAKFYDAAGVLRSTQTVTGWDPAEHGGDTEDVYFGFVDATNFVSSIVVTRSSSAGAQTTVVGDLVFTTVVPEPGLAMVLGAGCAMLTMRRRRR